MPKYQPRRPFLMLMLYIDIIAVITIITLGQTHYPMNYWVAGGFVSTIVGNITALWRDGVS